MRGSRARRLRRAAATAPPQMLNRKRTQSEWSARCSNFMRVYKDLKWAWKKGILK